MNHAGRRGREEAFVGLDEIPEEKKFYQSSQFISVYLIVLMVLCISM